MSLKGVIAIKQGHFGIALIKMPPFMVVHITHPSPLVGFCPVEFEPVTHDHLTGSASHSVKGYPAISYGAESLLLN